MPQAITNNKLLHVSYQYPLEAASAGVHIWWLLHVPPMAHGPQARSYKIQQNLQNNLGVEIFKEDPTTIYELQERLGKVRDHELILL